MNALIVGNRPLTRNIIQISKNKMIIAADGGADKLLEYEILPDKVIGDFDSISDKAATKLDPLRISCASPAPPKHPTIKEAALCAASTKRGGPPSAARPPLWNPQCVYRNMKHLYPRI